MTGRFDGKTVVVTGGTSGIAQATARRFAAEAATGACIDFAFANAGGGEFGAPADVTEAQFDKAFADNAEGLLFTAQKAQPPLRDGGFAEV